MQPHTHNSRHSNVAIDTRGSIRGCIQKEKEKKNFTGKPNLVQNKYGEDSVSGFLSKSRPAKLQNATKLIKLLAEFCKKKAFLFESIVGIDGVH